MHAGKTVTDPSNTAQGAGVDTISFAEVSNGVIVVRVMGRGSFANSVELKRLTDLFADKHGAACRFIMDLEQCATMDSTFMGVLASVGLRQRRDSNVEMVLANVNPQNVRLLQTLGLAHFMNVRPQGQGAPAVDDSAFQKAESADVSSTDRIVHMIEAHENLLEADSGNAPRFESVLKYLNESLERKKQP